jgi:competence ComEA-like helix-hairpin-helix protein
MNLTPDEARALAFIGGLVFLSAVVRVVDRPRPVTSDLPAVDVTALEAASRDALEGSQRTVPPLAAGEKLDPNRAEAADLMRLPRARRNVVDAIVAERDRGTRFETWADLDRVPGVGQVTLDAWREHLTLRAAPPASGRQRAGAVGGGDAAGTAQESPAPLDLNRATAAELERLPGVGPALAKRITAHRDSVGVFESVDELERVKGIGPALLARLRPHVRTGG